MSLPSDEELRTTVREMLRNADLSTLSAKKVRKDCEEKFGMDLTSRKAELDEIVMKLVNEMETEGAEGAGSDSDASNEQASNGVTAHSDSDSDTERKPSPKKKAKVSASTSKAKSKAEVGSDDDASSDSGVDDETLARKLQREAHGVRPRSAKAAEKKTRKTPKAAGTKTPRKTGNSVYSQECILSEDLAAILGKERMARKDVVKEMWAIFRERNLQDPVNKQFVNADDQLFKVFKVKRFKAFGMMKFLKNHIKDARLVGNLDES